MSDVFAGVRAVLFDVDGTLYRQTPVRIAMAAELAIDGVRSGAPSRVLRIVGVLRAFRQTREALRDQWNRAGLLEQAQYERCATCVGLHPDEVRALVDEWMMRRPLKHLRRARRPGVAALLAALGARGVRVGALSDYPVEAKLEALGVAPHFSLHLCTLDGAINAFKPHPAGFRRACALWHLDPEEVLYVGDRPEVDGAGARAAGTRCLIVGGRTGGAGFADLARAVVAG